MQMDGDHPNIAPSRLRVILYVTIRWLLIFSLISSGALAQSSSTIPGQTSDCCAKDQDRLEVSIDFGVTLDDKGFEYNCSEITEIDSQFVYSKSIVFGSTVDLFPDSVTRPKVVIRNDGACVPNCRASGQPAFIGDFWCQFKEGVSAYIPGANRGVNSFSAHICYIDDEVEMIAYDKFGLEIDHIASSPDSGTTRTSLLQTGSIKT